MARGRGAPVLELCTTVKYAPVVDDQHGPFWEPELHLARCQGLEEAICSPLCGDVSGPKTVVTKPNPVARGRTALQNRAHGHGLRSHVVGRRTEPVVRLQEQVDIT